MTLRRRLLIIAALLLVAVGIGATVLVPRWVLDRYRQVTARMGDDFRGDARAVDVDLWGFAYALHDVRVARRDGGGVAPLVQARRVHVRLHPTSRRALVRVQGLQLDLIAGGAGEQLGAGIAWRHFLDALAPGFTIDSVDVDDGELRLALADFPAAPVRVSQLSATLRDLHSVPTDRQPAPATLRGEARLLDHAPLRIDARFDPRGQMQRINVTLRIEDLDLARIDAYARAWNGIDFEAGAASVEVDFTSNESRVRGSMLARLRDVDVFDARQDLGRDGDGLLRAARDLLAGGAAALDGDRDLRVERRIDAQFTLPEDNLDGLRAALSAGFADIAP